MKNMMDLNMFPISVYLSYIDYIYIYIYTCCEYALYTYHIFLYLYLHCIQYIDDLKADEESLNEASTAAAYFVRGQYEKRNHVPYKRVFVHITTATDQENIQKVFWDVQNIVINSNLRKGGLV